MGLDENLQATPSVNVCVVNLVYNTSRSSATRVEVWLPDSGAYNGRLLGTGGFGLSGCVDYDNLNWGTSLNFAAFGHDGGHDGDSGAAFATSDEVIADYAHRGLHVATLAAKQLVAAYYGRAQNKSYYIGCSTGGRQGIRSVQDYPGDFDGVLAGSPVINLVRAGAAGLVWSIAGRALEEADWLLVRDEILRQCDGLDGVRDGVVSDPDACDFVPDTLLCAGEKRDDCLSEEQIAAVRQIHSPIYGSDGQLLAPRLDPGAESDADTWPFIFNPFGYPLAIDWFQNAVYRNASWEPSPDFGLKEIADADKRDAKLQVASFNPDLSAFRKRGGKLLTYHGTSDVLIPSGTSAWYYQSVSRKLSLPPSKLGDFYRLFLIPGMNHCSSGPGAWMFGQNIISGWSNSSDSHALFALVDWVEKGKAPTTLRGTGNADPNVPATRLHCSYPARSVWKVESKDWVCVDSP
ncbi:tannase and feruloyl esterase [Auricularia subglabra TFB-10046 SS5]|nr:tannase and feruloyl esterase [Auricularia subglabra TFB-10046 SS5]